MKVLVTLELEIADIPEHERIVMQDGFNFALPGVVAEDDTDEDEDGVPILPSLADYTILDIEDGVREVLNDLGGDYDTQAEMFAGSEVYFYFKTSNVLAVSVTS